MSHFTRPELPTLLLPASSDLPDALHQTVEGLWAQVFDEDFRRLHTLLQEKETLPDANLIREGLVRLAASIRGAAGKAVDQASNVRPMSRDELRSILSGALGDIRCDDKRIKEFAVYDEYFGVARSVDYSSDDFAANLTVTVLRLLDDLIYTLLNIDDLAALIYASEEMLRYCFGGGASKTSPGLQHATLRDDSKTASPPSSRKVDPMYRWRLGHHFFALSAAFSRRCLMAAGNRLPSVPPSELADLINSAHRSLRGTTAAMWYAANMSQEVYIGRIRPTMEDAQPGGFSGKQNLEYERLKKARHLATGKLCQTFGDSLESSPSEVREEFIAHCEAEVEDLEHHTLIAASKVSLNPSLLHADGAGYPAVDMLRLMSYDRRRDLGVFLDAK